MGVYRVSRADHTIVTFVHEPENSESQIIEIRNPSAGAVPKNIAIGDRFIISTTFQRSMAPVVESVEEPITKQVFFAAKVGTETASTAPVDPNESEEPGVGQSESM